MRKLLLWVLFFLLPFLYSIYVSAQSKKERDCSTTCFSSEVVAVEKISETCTSYEVKVSYSGDCAHALSHFTVAVPCGEIRDIWNSENWAQETGTDPTTGLSGFKIDNISNFGEGSLKAFHVKFTICSSGESCTDQLSCWQPVVAYKASTCVNFETLTVSCKALKASLQKSDVSCFGAADGKLSVVVEDGVEPYTFQWSNMMTTRDVSGLSAGTYSVIVRDAAGGTLTLEETITQPAALVLSGTTTAASCNGVADGSIDLTVSGGEGDYTFAWSNGQQTEDAQALAAGQYTVTVTDGKGCASSKTFTIGASAMVHVTGTQVRPDCNDSNGSIDITATGGTAPYTFEWSHGATTEDLANIAEGVYTVTVTDASGCSAKASFFVRENNTLLVTGTTTPAGCNDDPTGTVNLTVSGGTPPYTFKWSNGETSEDLSGLSSGYYTVTVTDSKGCTASAGFVVSKASFQVPATVVQPSCHGAADGSIVLQDPVGGAAPFTYEWSNGTSATSLTKLSAGTYTVIVTDAAGCSRRLTYTLTDPPAILATIAVLNAQCNADESFAIDLTTSGGTPPYTYQWSNGGTSEDVEGLPSGNYTVVITDANGCTITKEVPVAAQLPGWACTINAPAATPLCGSSNNTISTSVADADTYSWSVSSTDGQWSIATSNTASTTFSAGAANSSATFTLTISKDGCTQSCSYTVTACTAQDNNPGEEPQPGEPGDGGSETCEECFATEARLLETSSTCRTYEMVVSTNGMCRHELSHWTLAIPCGTVSNYSNSEGWQMTFGKDPTTGLFGLKVDNINDFGKSVDAFTVTFTVCGGSDCDLSQWRPTVAYKAGLCIGKETIAVSGSSDNNAGVSVYPNPFTGDINFKYDAVYENVDLKIVDQYGNIVSRAILSGTTSEGITTIDSSGLPRGMYYYLLTIDGRTISGKISKR